MHLYVSFMLPDMPPTSMEDHRYIVSARKYRPTTFRSVVGQDTLIATLQNAIQKNHLAHAYLFCGPRGVGKTTCARIFAKAINCSQLTPDGEPCGVCESCRAFEEQRSFNVHELDAASNNSVDNIRQLTEEVRIPPQIGKYNVYIIDEVHMLSTSAFNAFLKTLEEPPAHAIFILATTERYKVIPTILSRCQIYTFNRISVRDMVQYLQHVAQNEGITADPAALNMIARKADGAMRDALSIFDQINSFCNNNITYQATIENLNILDADYYFKLIDCFLTGNSVQSLLILDEILRKGFDEQHFVAGLAAHLRDLMMCRDVQTVSLLEVSSDVAKSYVEQAKKCSTDFIFRALDLANQCDLNYRETRNKRLLTELLLLRLCRLNAPAATEPKPIVPTPNIETTAPDTTKPETATHVQPQPVEPQSQTTVANTLPPMPGIKKKVTAPETTEAPAPQPPTEHRTQDFNDTQLRKAWLDFAKTVQDKAYEYNILTTVLPEKQGNNCVVKLINNHQQTALKNLKADMERTLSDALKNDNIRVELIVDEAIVHKSSMTQEEKFQNMQRKNPYFQKLCQELELDIT